MGEQKKRTVPTLDICEEKKNLFKPFILGEKQHEFQICFFVVVVSLHAVFMSR